MCSHEHTVETYPECDIVCTDCAFVVGQVYNKTNYTTLPPFYDESDDISISELLIDLTFDLHLPNSCIEPTKYRFRKLRANNDLCKYRNNELACFAVYNELLEQEIPTNLEDLCLHCHTTPARIWNIQKSVDNFICLEPVLLIPRIISELQLPFFLCDQMKQVVQKLEIISSAKPETIAACAIYITTRTFYENITLSSICQQCRISSSSVLSLYRRYGRSEIQL